MSALTIAIERLSQMYCSLSGYTFESHDTLRLLALQGIASFTLLAKGFRSCARRPRATLAGSLASRRYVQKLIRLISLSNTLST